MNILNKIKFSLNAKKELKETIQDMISSYKAEANLYKKDSPFEKRCKWKIEGLKELAERLEIPLE